MSNSVPGKELVFVTGATGYVGGRLVPALLRAGYAVRCLAREPRKLAERPWRNDPAVEVVAGDLDSVDRIAGQLRGCTAAYFLVHSMEASGREYAARDRLLAGNFARAASEAGIQRIIYLGGLGEMGSGLSQHLRSRREVETELASTGVPLTTFRAAMIIGSGSASFEILRYLVERLPVMVTPAWVTTESQPVAISDVLYWLVHCLQVPGTVGQTLEIGGPDVLPYRELMQIMAEELRIPRRLIVPVPLLTPRLSSLWISLVTPVSYRIARPLAEGLRNRVVVTNPRTQQLMPHPAIGVREAIRRALQKVESNEVETRWSVAGPIVGDPHWAGGKEFLDERSVLIAADPARVFAAVCRIGGGHGWYAGQLLWRIRGWMDNLVGGPGLRRGRRDQVRVEFGETLDFWRVVGIDRDRSLSLLAEMKLPGTARLDFALAPEPAGQQTRLTMTARYRPRGLTGILYWYAVAPLHNIVFGGMLKGIRKAAEQPSPSKTPMPQVPADDRPTSSGYGRARLWLGISAVGTMTLLAMLGLILGLPSGWLPAVEAGLGTQSISLLLFVGLYLLVHFPFDVMGGFWLPRRFGRQHPSAGVFLRELLRGMLVHGGLMMGSAVLITVAGRFAGPAGMVLAGLLTSLFLLQCRAAIATLLARLVARPPSGTGGSNEAVPVLEIDSADEGFTGGITGVLRPRAILFPARWQEVLGQDGTGLALRRRYEAIRSGSWLRGRMVALLFTATGLLLAAWLVERELVGSAAGTIRFALWFTVWSFLGLLTLPTLSRRGVMEVDDRIRALGYPPPLVREVAERLDQLQDGEPSRPGLVETIFHPIPSVENRLEGPRSHRVRGYHDAARTAVFLGTAGLGLLGRAVHCNCGRPALWAFLPSD